MKDRARELYDFLREFTISEGIPTISRDCGMTVIGWSLGGTWVTALLAHMETFEGNKVTLKAYLNKFIMLGVRNPFVTFLPHSELLSALTHVT